MTHPLSCLCLVVVVVVVVVVVFVVVLGSCLRRRYSDLACDCSSFDAYRDMYRF